MSVVGVASSTWCDTACSSSELSCSSGGQQRVAGDEGDDELGRVVELLPVTLLRQRVDVRPKLPSVDDHVGAPVGVGGGVVGVEERLERHLGVDHHPTRPRQRDHHVGPEPSVGAGRGHLLLEVAVLDHPRHLDHSPQLHLPHRPRVAGERSAVTRLRVSDWSLSWDWVRVRTCSLNPV